MCDSPVRRDGHEVAQSKDVVLTIFPEERVFANDPPLGDDGGGVVTDVSAAKDGGGSLVTVAAEARKHAVPSQNEEVSVKPQEYTISVEKGAAGIGVDVLQHVGGGLIVTQVKLGPVATWNSAHPEARVCKDDTIVEVNGVRGDCDQLIAAIKAATALEIVLSRGEDSKDRKFSGEEFAISIQRPVAGRLGVDIDPGQHTSGSFLLVLSVGAGPVLEWNTTAAPEKQVLPGDKIVEVNGTAGKELMLGVLRAADQMSITLLRGNAASVSQAQAAVRATPARPIPERAGKTVQQEPPTARSDEASDNREDGGDSAGNAAATPSLQTGDYRWPFGGSGGSARAIRLAGAAVPPCEAA